MTYLTLLIPSFILGGLLWLMVRDRTVERKAWAQERALEREIRQNQDAAWAKERADLLQRIQAPRIAIEKHQADHDVSDEPVYVNPADDEAWERYIEAREAGQAV